MTGWRNPFVRLTSNLAGVLLMTRGCVGVLWLQFQHASRLILIQDLTILRRVLFHLCGVSEQKRRQCLSKITTSIVVKDGTAPLLFIVRGAGCH